MISAYLKKERKYDRRKRESAAPSQLDVLNPANKAELSIYQPYAYKEVCLEDFELPSFHDLKDAANYYEAIMKTLKRPNNGLEDRPDRDYWDLRDSVTKVIAYDNKFKSHRGTEELISLGLISPDDPDLPWIEGKVTVKKIPDSTQ